MNSIDLFKLTRVRREFFADFEKMLSGREEKLNAKPHEFDDLEAFVEILLNHHISEEGLNHFYFSYVIPQIGKEFDLLRISPDMVMNIELKSRDVGQDDIIRQLQKNKYYLSHLSRDIYLFTFVSSEQKFYKYLPGDTLAETSAYDIVNLLKQQRNCYTEDINSLFRVSEFLVSPMNTPDRFINKHYFLTTQQKQFQKEIISSMSSKYRDEYLFRGITGEPGTGKTLTLYDLAYSCAENEPVGIVHCGNLTDGHIILDKAIPNFDIYSVTELDNRILGDYKYIFIDESHRIYPKEFKYLISIVKHNHQACIFSYDRSQVLSASEFSHDMVKSIQALPNFHEYVLSKKIRTNREIASFIRKLFNLNIKDKYLKYSSVKILYANNEKEAITFIKEYKNKNFVFINYSKSPNRISPFDIYSNYESIDTHKAIGQEFDNVLMIMDDTFYYSPEGRLLAKAYSHQEYLYEQLLYQGLTRAREKLVIIVVNNEDLLANMLSILTS